MSEPESLILPILREMRAELGDIRAELGEVRSDIRQNSRGLCDKVRPELRSALAAR